MWTETYRPQRLDDVLGQDMRGIRHCVTHLLLFGPPGTGKTTTAHILARETAGHAVNQRVPFGTERILCLNASDDRHVDVVRTTIVRFCHKKRAGTKVVILDEAERLTTAAQHNLRRVMEEDNDTRFILMCNNVHNIIDPLQSRCALFRFNALADELIRERLLLVARREKQSATTVRHIVEAAAGDMRRALVLLQAANRFKDDIFTAVGRLPDNVFVRIQKRMQSQPSYETCVELVQDLYLKGHQLGFVPIQIGLVSNAAHTIRQCALADAAIASGGDERLFVLACLWQWALDQGC